MNDIDLLTFRFFDEYYPLYVWIITVICMHLLFIIFPNSRLTKKQWIKFDYLYYFLATMSLIGILSNAEKYSIDKDMEYLFERGFDTYEERLDNVDRHLNDIIFISKNNFYENNITNEKFIKYENYFKLTKRTIRTLKENEIKRLKSFFHEYKSNKRFHDYSDMTRIDDNNTKQKFIYVSDTYKNFIEVNKLILNENSDKNICSDIVGSKYTNKQWCNDNWIYNIQLFDGSLYHLHESYIELTYLAEKSRGKDLQFFLLFFAPYLLAFVLGIRISKVSAELVGFKE